MISFLILFFSLILGSFSLILLSLGGVLMNIDYIVKELEVAHQRYEPILERRANIIEKEVEFLLKFIEKIFNFTTKKTINGKVAVLVYVFPENNKELISNEVYLTSDGHITYQVFDETAYKGFVPDAIVENGYVKVKINYFLETIPLIHILDFFEKRPQVLTNSAFEIDELNSKRLKLLDLLSEVL